MKKVYFVGAGPGDPELLTLKGHKILKQADVIIYTGSLIDRTILNYAKPKAQKYDSASMHLGQIVELIARNVHENKRVLRLCSGDPNIYGAIQEQIDMLNACGIDCEVIPGVSSFLAAAAKLQRELTLPGVSQTIIITRPAGRTPTLKSEEIRKLAAHGATMAIFLGIQQIRKLCKELTQGGYPKDTPVAVLHKVTWPEETIINGTIETIAYKIRKTDITKTALVIVGRILSETRYKRSKLYDSHFTHTYRRRGELKRSKKASR